MNIFHNRPLFISCFAFLLFSVIGYFLSWEYKLFLIAVLLLIAAVAFLIRIVFKKIPPYVFLCMVLSLILSFVALISSFLFFNVKGEAIESYYGENHSIEAIVISREYSGASYSGFEIIVTEIDGQKTNHKAKIEFDFISYMEPGYRFVADNVNGIGFESSSGSYDEKLDMNSEGIFIKYESGDNCDVNVTDMDAFHPQIYFKKLNEEISRIFDKYLDTRTAKLCSAIFLGNKSALPDTVKRDFTRAGASHILALSGLHMSVIMGAMMFFLKKFKVGRKCLAVILTLCAIFYLFLTGFQISAARSVIMLLCVYASWILSGSPDPLTSLMISATSLMLILPGSVIDAAYWMSFAATLGILVYMLPFTKYINELIAQYNWPDFLKKWTVKLLSLIAVSVFAAIPLIIVLCLFIKQYSLYSIVSAIVLGVPTAGIIILSLILVVFSEVGFVATFVSGMIVRLSDFMIGFCERISDNHQTVFSLNYPFILIIASLLGAALLYSFIVKRRNLFVSLVPFGVTVLLFVSLISLYNGSGKGKIDVSYVNAGAYSDMLVITDNLGHAVICDVGNGSKSSYYKAMDAMYEQRALEIDTIVLAKYSNYHNNTLSMVFSKKKVWNLWLPYPQNETEYNRMLSLSELAEQHGVKVSVYNYDYNLYIFENTSLKLHSYYINRSKKPISIVSVWTENDRLTYCSSAFNECSGIEDINTRLSKSQFVIFGDMGPNLKTEYSIPLNSSAEFVVFSDENRASYYKDKGLNEVDYYVVSEACRMRLTE